MHQSDIFAAELLEISAGGYATLAAGRLLAAHPEVAAGFAPDAQSAWKAALGQRVLELATAIRLGEPRLFAARVAWARRAFAAREVPESALRASLEALASVLDEELPEPARAAPGKLIGEALAELDHPGEEHGSYLDPRTFTGKLALEYLATVLEGDSRAATDRVLAAVDGGLSIESAYLDLLVPAQREVGRLWHSGELGIVEEHVVTSTTDRLMALLSHRAAHAPGNGKTVVCAAVAGNVHDIGVRVIADFFDMAGWRAVHLGASVPAAEIATGLQYFNGDLLMLSAALSVQLPKVTESIEAVRRLEGRTVRIVVGGLAFTDAPELWRKLGADGYAPDPPAAMKLGAELVSA